MRVRRKLTAILCMLTLLAGLVGPWQPASAGSIKDSLDKSQYSEIRIANVKNITVSDDGTTATLTFEDGTVDITNGIDMVTEGDYLYTKATEIVVKNPHLNSGCGVSAPKFNDKTYPAGASGFVYDFTLYKMDSGSNTLWYSVVPYYNHYRLQLRGVRDVSFSNGNINIIYDNGTVSVPDSNVQIRKIEYDGVTYYYLFSSLSSITYTPLPDEGQYAYVQTKQQTDRSYIGSNTFAYSAIKYGDPLDQYDYIQFDFDRWDGDSVYFAWATDDSNNTGEFHYKKIDGITAHQQKLVNVADVKDGTVGFELSKQEVPLYEGGKLKTTQSYEFCWTQAFENILASTEFQSLTTASEKMAYIRNHRDVTIDPVGAPDNTPNCINTGGDHNFILTIYKQGEYEPVQLNVDAGQKYGWTYNDQMFTTGLFDIGGSSLSNPGVFHTFLLQDKVTIGNATGGFSDIEDVELASEVGNGVTVSKANGVWTIEFKSNFYDDVTVKIVKKDGTTGYISIVRKNIRLQRVPGDNENTYIEIWYPNTDSYKDYKVILTGVNADGTTETHVIDEHVKMEDPFDPNIKVDETEYAEGNTKSAWFKASGLINRGGKYTHCYISVVKNLDASATSYGGTLLGNGIGVEYKDAGSGMHRVLKCGKVEEHD